MSEGRAIDGMLLLDRALLRHKVWTMERPYSRGQAWVDLLLKANDQPTATTIRGHVVDLERGQCAWSKKGLALEWGWSQVKVSGFLAWLEGNGMVKIESSEVTTIITITHYCEYQSEIIPGAYREQTVSRPRADQDGRGKGVPEMEGEGEGDAPPAPQVGVRRNSPEIGQAVRWFAESGSGYPTALVEAVWHSFEGTKKDGEWYRGRALVSDWRSAMSERLSERFMEWQKNNAAPAGEVFKAGPPPIEAGVPGSVAALVNALDAEGDAE
jgi:hypothetical protein